MAFDRQQMRNRRRRKHLVRRIFLLLVCTLVLVGVWYGTRLKFFTITTVHVSGGTTIDLHAVEQKAQAVLNGSYFFLVPRRFAYTYPHDAIEDAIEHAPRVAHATVMRTSRTSLSVTLLEYTPYALWCTDGIASSAESVSCLFISENGFAFAEAPSLQGAAFVRYVTEDRTPKVGTVLESSDSIQATKEFSTALMRTHHMQVYAITETSDGDVRYHISGGGELLAAKDANLQKVLENLDTVLDSPEFKHIKSGNFVYIDLRFGNKVFVKE